MSTNETFTPNEYLPEYLQNLEREFTSNLLERFPAMAGRGVMALSLSSYSSRVV